MNIIAHKIALAPNNRQATLLRQHCGAARVAYNWAWAEFKSGLNEDVFLNDQDLRKRFNAIKGEMYPWMADLSQNAGKNAIMDFGAAVKNWVAYRRALKKGKPARKVGFPKRRKLKRCGYRYQADNGVATVRVEGKRIKLPGIGWVRMREEPRFAGPLRSVHISEKAGKWFVSLAFADGEYSEPAFGYELGLDMGLKTLAKLSDGGDIISPKALAAHLSELRRLNRKLARQVFKSKGWNATKRKIGRLHMRMANIRADHAHKATTEIVNRAGLGKVLVETLNISGMMRNRKVARAFADAGVGEFLRMLKYKCARAGIEFEKIDRWYPSSQICHECGWRNRTLRLAQRDWECDGCGIVNDRDLNAALNIRDYVAESSSDTLNARLGDDGNFARERGVEGGPFSGQMVFNLGI